MITVACVLRSGAVYDATWVARLRDGVARHLSAPHRFVAISDVPVPCERIALTEDWPGWWSKIALFRPGLLTGPTLYLDLDSIVTGDLAPLIRANFTMVADFLRPSLRNSSVMVWDGDMSSIYDAFAADPMGAMRAYRGREDGRIGDQAFIEDHAEAGTFPPGLVVSYRCHARYAVPGGASVVAFHGRPKPNEINEGWVKTAWG